MDSDDGGISYEPDNDYYPESDDGYVYRHDGYRSVIDYSF